MFSVRLPLVGCCLALAVARPARVDALEPVGQPARPLVMPPRGVPSLWHGGFVAATAFTSDGKLITAAADGHIRVWDVSTGKELRRLSGHKGAVLSLALTPDGRTLASGGADGSVRVWDFRSGRELRRHEGHGGEVTALALSPDGKRLVSADAGGYGDFRRHRALVAT